MSSLHMFVESNDEEEAASHWKWSVKTSQSHGGCSVKTGYTDSSSEEEEDLHVDVDFDGPIDRTFNWFSVFKIEF